jgi:Ca-activated chloride channel family protein
MSVRSWLRTPRVRRSLAVSALVLSAGALVLHRSPADARPSVVLAVASGKNATSFQGVGARGALALSHEAVLAGGERRVFAELSLTADAAEARGRERAPLALVVVLDTSGSMEGDKIDRAKEAVAGLVRDMRDDDEIALVRYASDSELMQPLARVGDVREALLARVRGLQAGGGTNIPPALARGLATLEDARAGRVKRIVLVSDGLDGSRVEAQATASRSFESGVTVSSLGVGLDFDGAYMGGVAQSGHGNFAFVKDAGALAAILRRELDETATTTLEGATARLRLPPQMTLVRAHGADARIDDGAVVLSLGALAAGAERRVVLELAVTAEAGEALGIEGTVAWRRVGGEAAEVRLARLSLRGTSDAREAEASRDGAIFADATSVLASVRQLEATAAYEKGDTARAGAIIQENVVALRAAAAAAPPAAAPALTAQASAYDGAQRELQAAAPGSDRGKAAAKAAAEKDVANLSRRAF